MRYDLSVRLVAVWVTVGVLAGCGGTSARGAGEASAPAGDDAAMLAASLPVGANRCTVARPGRMPQTRRSLFVRLSQSDPLAWTADAPFATFAVAERVGPDGHRSAVVLARTTAPPDAVRRWIDTHAPTRVRWGDADADDPPAFLARFVDGRTLRLSLGAWPVTRGEGAGAEQRCVELARSFPEAVEVASRHGEVVVLGAHAHMPRRTDVVVLADEQAVTVTRNVQMASESQAEDRRRELGDTEPLSLSVLGGDLFPDRIEHRRRGSVLSTRVRVLWEDLVLALEDQRRMAAAIAEDARRHLPRPADTIDVSNRAVVDQQVALWLGQVQALRGAARRAAAEELRTLLDQAVVAHPSALDLSRQLARLLIDELSDGASAVEVAERVLSLGPADPEAWRVLRREAQAVVGRDALAVALVDDGVVERADAPRAAEDLVALQRQGVDYGFAEGAWVAARAIESRADRLRLRDVTAAELPIESLGESLGELVEIGSRREGAAALYVLARGERSGHRILWHPDNAPVVAVHDTAGAARLVGVASTDDTRLRAVGRTITDGLQLGPVELAVYAVPLGGSPADPEVVVRLFGTLATDRFRIERASGGAARIDWREVVRILGAPLEALEPRVYPPPELVVDVIEEAEARRLRELAADDGGIACVESVRAVRCTAAPESPEAARALLSRFASEKLERAGRLFRQ